MQLTKLRLWPYHLISAGLCDRWKRPSFRARGASQRPENQLINEGETRMTKTMGRMLSICITAAGTVLLTAQARGQCTPPVTTNGPDVVVGDITGPTQYGATGGYDALSLGTYSCNIGNVPLGWHANTNQHPVIGGALFRLKTVNGTQRFEQVGTSWLKHGFFALSNNLCCSGCIGDPSGATLGVHCSDPYTSSRNGTPSGLGPRWPVNAHTGFFPYPPPHPSGGNNGRLQVKVSEIDLTSTGTRYFGEAMYVTADDAAAGNQDNNASYIEMSTSGGPSDYNFSMAGSTQRAQQAINAWKKTDSSVNLQTINIPNDGIVILGNKTTDLGGGVYHYEYALYNMNCDVSIGSFSLPVPANVTVTNIGFHDFDYLAGDGIGGVNQSSTDWPGAVSAGAITWATTPFASNQNANAIRWQGLYNFRFDANAAPVQGTITLGTFKNAGTVQITGDVPSGTASVGTSYCFGDGTTVPTCPCLNLGMPGNGCANSQNPNGAVLQASGTTTPDTVVLASSGELPNALTIFLQGDATLANPAIFGSGLRCASGNLKRIGTHNAVGGAVSYPQGGDLSITASSAALGDPIAPGATRYYLAYYRDPNLSFCTPDGFNSTQGIAITWN
jgi:hypothetical protein